MRPLLQSGLWTQGALGLQGCRQTSESGQYRRYGSGRLDGQAVVLNCLPQILADNSLQHCSATLSFTIAVRM